MRQGGAQYFALDITNPALASYPSYLWEFPREDAPAALTNLMGESWSEPVITKVRLAVNGDVNNGEGHERWVAIFAGGYAPSGDPNKHASYDIHATAGRAIFMVDIKTGGLIAQKAFVDTPAATDPTLVAYDPANPERSMLYAMPSTPGVFDLDFDGYSDVVYVGDLGGNVFKWVIKAVGHDPVNSASGDTSQPNWVFEKFFAAPVYDSGTSKYFKSFFQHPSATLKSGTLWLAFGSGERANLDFAGFAATPDENNRFYAVKDLDPLGKLPPVAPLVMTESTLLDITGDDSCADVGANTGFYFMGVDGEKFVTATDIFFYYVFVASFKPTVNASPCLSGGDATLYAFKVYCGEGLFDDPAGDPLSSIALGDGFPTDPKVSLSSEDGGSRVFINKKDEVLNKDTGFKLGGESGQAYWREVNQ
jgi:type IV pilus assembly protein PilY1